MITFYQFPLGIGKDAIISVFPYFLPILLYLQVFIPSYKYVFLKRFSFDYS